MKKRTRQTQLEQYGIRCEKVQVHKCLSLVGWILDNPGKPFETFQKIQEYFKKQKEREIYEETSSQG